jgi:4'-phosphopantetheinyl transferase EntD
MILSSILPSTVRAVEAYVDLPGDDGLFPEEAALVTRALDKRRREFTTVRRCARKALADLGFPQGPILPGVKNEPLWPTGVVGSMTHCDGFRAAALALSRDVAAVGIDAEPHRRLPDGVLEKVARPEEIPALAELSLWHPSVHWDNVTFSAKESVYKAWFPLARCWLDFQDATLRFDPANRTFIAEIHKTAPAIGRVSLTRMLGRYVIEDGLVVTAVVIEY